MNFDYAFKVFELNLLRQSGVMVTPQQVGLSSDPLAAMQLKGATSMFGNMLSQVTGNGSYATNSVLATAMTPPVPPTPPANPSDPVAQAKYQQALLTYQSNFQIYNQRYMQLMLNQMSNMQMSMQSAQTQSIGSSSSSSGSSSPDMGIGGIL